MVLAFEFQYISQNGVLENLLKNIAVDFEIAHKIIKDGSIVTLYVEDTSDKLGLFADFLSTSLPLSIFFKSSSVQVVAEIPPIQETIPSLCNFTIEFTPRILSEIKDVNSSLYLNPFATTTQDNELILSLNGVESFCAKDASGFNKLYEEMATLIEQGENIQIKTKSGNFCFGKVENINTAKIGDDFEIIATDMSILEKMVVIRENEMKVLASLERPSLRLKVNSLYAAKGILPTQRVKLRLADDLLIHLLCERLFAKGIYFIFKVASKNFTCNYVLDFEKTLPFMEPLEITILENGEILIVKGKSYASKSLIENLEKFKEHAHASFASIMQEHQLFDSTASCFYLSKTHDDKFMNYSKENGMLNLVNFDIPSSFSEIFEQLSQSGESGQKLVENYQNSFPDIFASALKTEIPQNSPKNVYTLWKIASIILGLSDNFESGAEKIIENAEDFGGKKGPRIDYYLLKDEALISDFNALKFIRSGMSFKLAGTDDTTLSFGHIESLGYFLSDMADYYKENLLNEKIALGGSLFAYKRFAEIACKNIKPNHTICTNRELPIDQ